MYQIRAVHSVVPMNHLNQLQFFVSSSNGLRAEITRRLRQLSSYDVQVQQEMQELRRLAPLYRAEVARAAANACGAGQVHVRDEVKVGCKRKRRRSASTSPAKAGQQTEDVVIISSSDTEAADCDCDHHHGLTTDDADHVARPSCWRSPPSGSGTLATGLSKMSLTGQIEHRRATVHRLCEERARVSATLNDCCVELNEMMKGRLAHFRKVLSSAGEL